MSPPASRPSRGVFLFLAIAFAASGCGSKGAAPAAPGYAGPPDVVLLTLDTFRADRAGCMGHPGGLTPAIDALVRNGTLAARAFAPAPLTAISHASLLTGLEPPAHGVRENAMFPLPEATRTLPGFLREKGFTTAAFVSGLPLERRFGFGNGFDHFDDALDPARAGDPNYPERPASSVREAVAAYLDSHPTGRLFLWAHFFDAHHPRRVLPALKKLPALDDYDREIRGLDVTIRRLAADFAARRGVPYFVVATDHGEGFGEHGEFSHGVLLYEEVMHAIFAVAPPPGAASTLPAGILDTLVRFSDLAPTLAELLGVGAMPGVAGRSLFTAPPADLAAYGESYYAMFHYGWSPLTALRTAEWTYVESPEPELFDRRNDPGERRNVLASHPRIASDLAARLRAQISEPEIPRTGAVDDATEQQLASLGYVAGTSGPAADRRKNPRRLMPAANALFRGITLQSEGKLSEALVSFQHAYRVDPDNFSVLFQLADCLRQLGDPISAMSYYRRAVSIHPGAWEAVAHLAVLTFDQGRREEALRSLDDALEQSPANFVLLMTRGDLALQIGEAARAEDLFRRACEAEPRRADPWIGLAESLEAQGDRRAAEAPWNRARQIDPEHPRLSAARPPAR